MSKRSAAKDGSAAYTAYQQRRRAAALERQKAARQNVLHELRSLAAAATQDGFNVESNMEEDIIGVEGGQSSRRQAHHVRKQRHGGHRAQRAQQQPDPSLLSSDSSDPGRHGGAALRAFFARQLMMPEWLTDVPPDLAATWLVMPRPEGRRCLVVSSGGVTISRTRTGAMLHRFASQLPAGGPAGGAGSAYCVLDCIYQEHGLGQQQQQQQQQQGKDQQPLDSRSGGGGCGNDDGAMDEDNSDLHQHPQLGQSQSHAHAAPAGVYYVQDVLAWRGYGLSDCGAEFRLYWLQTKLGEEEHGAGLLAAPSASGGGVTLGGNDACTTSHHQVCFCLLPYWRATPEGLSAAAAFGTTAAQQQQQQQQGGQQQQQQQQCGVSVVPHCAPAGFVQDGLYLRHVEGHYDAGEGATPLALLWKDEDCSRYLLDTDAAGVVPQQQQLVLRYQGPEQQCGVATSDVPPVVLARLPQAFVAQMGASLRPGRLLRFGLPPGGLLFAHDGSPAGAALSYIGPVNHRRGRADSLSKIVFQHNARTSPLRLAGLMTAAAAGAAAAGAAAAGAAAAAACPASAPALMALE